ncbi:MAG: amidohydrolase family protein [Chloroflexi bacterium]|nr:amidohydrolase family protein [Chloroflexota bacterium]
MSGYDILLRHGRLLDHQGLYDVALRDGLVAAVGLNIEGTARETYDVDSRLILPAFVDSHVHLDKAFLADEPNIDRSTRAGFFATLREFKCNEKTENIKARMRRIAIYGHCMHDFWVNPLSYEEMARTFPDVSVILGHMGILWSVAEAGMVAQRNPNVYLETSVVPLRSLRIGLQMAGAEKVVFGTDWPANDYDMQLEMIRRATRNEAEFKFVAGENLARLLKIS